jgi:hypothetical protein
MKRILFALFSGFLAVASSSSAIAQTKDKTFKDWAVYTTNLQGKQTCYVASLPKSDTGNYAERSDAYFLVTKLDNNNFEVSTSSGYEYKVNSDVKVDIGGSKFIMFSKGDLAWANDSKQDKEMIDTMIKKSEMDVRGTSVKGTYSVDRYSLAGFGSAYKHMQSLCNK